MYVCWKITRKPCRSTLDGLSVGLLVGDCDAHTIYVGVSDGKSLLIYNFGTAILGFQTVTNSDHTAS